MEVPATIRKAADESRRIIQEISEGAKRNPEEETGSEQAAPAPAEEEVITKPDDAGGEEPREEKPQPEPEKEEEGEESWQEKHDALKAKFDALDRRFNVLKGKYDAETPRYAQRDKELSRQVQELNQAIQGLEAENRRLKEEGVVKAVGEINPEEYEDYGPEIVTLANKTMWALSELEKLQKKLPAIEQQVGGVYGQVQAKSYNEFLSSVREQYPGFEKQNADSEFTDWARWMYGADVFEKLERTMDVERAVRIYEAWPDAGRYQGVEAPPKKKEPPSREVKKQVAPPRSRPGEPAPQGGKTWSRADIKQFYDDVNAGKYTSEESIKIKKDIFAAQADGRVTQ